MGTIKVLWSFSGEALRHHIVVVLTGYSGKLANVNLIKRRLWGKKSIDRI